MSDEQSTHEVPDLSGISVAEIKPEDVGTLSLRYVDGVPQLVVSGGKAIPAQLMVVDGEGATVAVYGAAAPVEGIKNKSMIVNPDIRLFLDT